MADHAHAPEDRYQIPAQALGRTRTAFLAVGALGLVLSAVGFALDRAQFFHSYLVAVVFVLSVSLGCLFFVMLHHATRAGWSVAVRRLAEVAAAAVPVLAILFIPVLLGMRDLFPWTRPEVVGEDPLLRGKQPFLNVPFFVARAAFYFAAWTWLSRYFLRASVAQDTSRDYVPTIVMQRRAAPGIILYGLTLTLLAFDWLMSLDPHWYSTIFGVYLFSGTTWVGFAFLTLAALFLRRGGHLTHTIRTDHFQDLGRLLFAFSVFWAYIAFSQFLLIWYGNIPEETIWYVHRIQGSWREVSLFLFIGHFAIPSVLLMSRWTKRRPVFVAALAAWALFMHYLDLYWIVMPNLHHEGLRPHWIDLATLLAVGGVFLTVFIHRLPAHAAVPTGDPRLRESLALEHLY
jgi:hypothetical protein